MSDKEKPILWRNYDFILLFLGGFISRVGNAIHMVALTWFVLDTTGSGTITGAILFWSYLPGVLLGPLAGVLADRISRKLIIVSMDIIRGLVVIWLSWAIYYEVATITHLTIATLLIAICGSFFNPAVAAAMPELVNDRQLQQANSYNYFSLNFTAIIGAAVGGLLIIIFGVAGVFLIDGISYLISGISEWFINMPKVKNERENNWFEDLKHGAKFLYGNKSLLFLLNLTILLNFLFSGILVVGVPYIFKKILLVESGLYGISQSIFPAGGALGALMIAFMPEIKEYYKTMAVTISLQTLTIFFMGIVILPVVLEVLSTINVYLIMLAMLLFFGVFNAIGNIPINVLLQRLIPNNIRGRIMGLFVTLNQALIPFSMALIGWLLDIMPAYIIFTLAGSSLALVLLVGLRNTAIRNIDCESTLLLRKSEGSMNP